MNIEVILASGANKRRNLIDEFKKIGIGATVVENRHHLLYENYLKIS